MSGDTKPFERSRPVGKVITCTIVVVGLLLLVISNSDYLKDIKFLNGDLDDLISNIGFAVLLAAVFQWIFDTRFKEHFFEDIRSEIISSQSIAQSGLMRVWDDSKKADYGDRIANTKRVIRIGVTYSDRFIKDYFSRFEKIDKSVKIVVYLSNVDVEECRNAIAFNTKQSPDDILRFGNSLKNYIAALQEKDLDVEVVSLDSMPHYSFVSFDDTYHFIILSTFSSRRADVPMLECGAGVFHELVMSDILEAESCKNPVLAPSKGLLSSLKSSVSKAFGKQ